MKTCIICSETATHNGNVGLMLPGWQGRWKSAGDVRLCALHAKTVNPIVCVEPLDELETQKNEFLENLIEEVKSNNCIVLIPQNDGVQVRCKNVSQGALSECLLNIILNMIMEGLEKNPIEGLPALRKLINELNNMELKNIEALSNQFEAANNTQAVH